jgi:4-hydroxybenzoate polyprenyltransferase
MPPEHSLNATEATTVRSRHAGHGGATRSVMRAVRRADRLVRIHFVGFTCVWPLLGLGATPTSPSGSTLLTVLTIGVCFHLFGFLLNDVVDLPIDRTQPRRARDPLVRGSISAGTVLVLATLQIPIAFVVAWRAGADVATLVALAVAFGFMAIYNVYGKRSRVPVLTDLVLGLSGGAFVIFGAGMSDRGPSSVTILVASYTALYFLLFNGIHGGMRDMENDAECGVRTTGLYLGMRPTHGTIEVPRRAKVFCWSLHITLAAILCVLAVTSGYDHTTAGVVLGVSLAMAAGNTLLMHIVLTPEHPRWEEAYRLHLLTLVLAVIFVVSPMMSAGLSVGMTLLFVVPMATLIERAPQIVGWLLPGRRTEG